MPCMGPSMPTNEEIDQVTKEVMQFLREKHGIQDGPAPFPTKINEENRAKDRAKLREAVKELLDGKACEEF